MSTHCSASYPQADVMSLTVLRDFARKLLVVRPNARTKLEIFKELLDYMKKPKVLHQVDVFADFVTFCQNFYHRQMRVFDKLEIFHILSFISTKTIIVLIFNPPIPHDFSALM